jgi:arabinoxylan arabinofuranohydrolase
MKKNILNTLVVVFVIQTVLFAQKANIKYPYKFTAKGNPFITHMYTADPSARVFNGRLYLYPSHDRDTTKWFDMDDWHVFSTSNMKDWTDHGVRFKLSDIKWAKKYAWAPDCAYKNGKYYFYYPTDKEYIGVAIGKTPLGPFKDPLKKPLLSRDTKGVICTGDFIDPTVFVDDDGSTYIYFGQNQVNVVKLNEDMVSFNDSVSVLQGTTGFFEAVWMHKYKGKYYLSYSGSTSGRRKILYCMSDSPYGPFEYKGEILAPMNSCTNHHSIVEFKGQWYLFYHNSDLYYEQNPDQKPVCNWNSAAPFRRSLCVDYLYYNEDGTIKQVIPTKTSVAELPD